MNESQSLMKGGLEKRSVTARDGYIKLKEGFVKNTECFSCSQNWEGTKARKCFRVRWESSEIHWLGQA